MSTKHPLGELRAETGLTQREFAERLGSKRGYIAQIESTAEPMGKELALRCQEKFSLEMDVAGITLEELLRGRRATPEEGADGVVRYAR